MMISSHMLLRGMVQPDRPAAQTCQCHPSPWLLQCSSGSPRHILPSKFTSNRSLRVNTYTSQTERYSSYHMWALSKLHMVDNEQLTSGQDHSTTSKAGHTPTPTIPICGYLMQPLNNTQHTQWTSTAPCALPVLPHSYRVWYFLTLMTSHARLKKTPKKMARKPR